VAKFATGVAATTQQQGIVVEQAHDKLLRFETYSEGGQTYLFVAAIDRGSAEVLGHEPVGGGAPVYLRLYRTNDYFTLAYSTNGTAWRSRSYHRPFEVTAIGPYVGNGGYSPPAFEGRIDYFRVGNGNTPPPTGL
jgi:large repetitive protein